MLKYYSHHNRKLDWSTILKEYVPEDFQKKFSRTNSYDAKGTTGMFMKFIAYLKENRILKRSPRDLVDRNASFAVTLQRNNSNDKQKVDWENIVQSYKLNDYGITFVREAPIRTRIEIEKLVEDLEMYIANNNLPVWTPDTVYECKPQYLKWLAQHYR